MRIDLQARLDVLKPKFNILYVDPPWSFKTYSDKGKGRSPKYPVMGMDDICAMDIEPLIAPNCALFLWATYPCLEQALEVIRAWGFCYKTVAFSWVKLTKLGKPWHIGTGYYTRANPEICLLGMRGRLPRQSKGVRNLVVAPVGVHSAKPSIVRDMIVELFGSLPRLELFARDYTPGWSIWGNEVESAIKIGRKHGSLRR